MYYVIYDTLHLFQNYSIDECETEKEAFERLEKEKKIHGWDGVVVSSVVKKEPSDKPPTESGWYWVKRKGWVQPFVYWYEVGNDYVGYVGSDIHVREVELWLGPIPEPELLKG